MDEFSLINHFFKSSPLQHKDVMLGIGDDAACLNLPSGFNLLVSTDTLVSGVHFLPEWSAYDIAIRSAMVNISDMAAMAAEPRYATLAVTLPEFNEQWLDSFSQGMKDSFAKFGIDLIGGDTTRGPLSITLTILGLAPHYQAVTRAGAKPGDIIMVSGPLGAAALAIKRLDDKTMYLPDKTALMSRLLHPMPRVDLIELIRAFATSAIDISDGLSADLNHICQSSQVGALLDKRTIPVHPLLNKYLEEQAVDFALTGGDDYELCFTVDAARLDELNQKLTASGLRCYPIGIIEKQPGLRIKVSEGRWEHLQPGGYSHF